VKLLLDANVVIDVVLARRPWAVDAVKLLDEIEAGGAAGFVAGHTVTTAHYIFRKALGSAGASAAIAAMLRVLDVVPADKADFFHAAALGGRDFEDAVQMVCALKVGADYIVTRDEKDFQGSTVPVRTPGSVLALL
jgi:predicted nucleic acid-binding protein